MSNDTQDYENTSARFVNLNSLQKVMNMYICIFQGINLWSYKQLCDHRVNFLLFVCLVHEQEIWNVTRGYTQVNDLLYVRNVEKLSLGSNLSMNTWTDIGGWNPTSASTAGKVEYINIWSPVFRSHFHCAVYIGRGRRMNGHSRR